MLDQHEYAKAQRTIAHPDIGSKPAEDAVCTELHNLYRSLLGAVAYLTLTRLDIAVFVSALQRWSHAPNIIHVKRPNALTRWVQANPKGLVYNPLSSTRSQMADGNCHFRIFRLRIQ